VAAVDKIDSISRDQCRRYFEKHFTSEKMIDRYERVYERLIDSDEMELAMIWQLLQVRKLNRTPLIVIGRMWADFVSWGRQYLLRPEFPLANPEDLAIPHCVDTAEQAITVIRKRHQEWVRESDESK
jgi:hypothetical protein